MNRHYPVNVIVFITHIIDVLGGNRMRTNKDKLIRTLVSGVIRHPSWPRSWSVGHDGKVDMLAGCGGIVYNVRVGDDAYGWAADHLEPGVSTHNSDEKEKMAYYILACMGNKAEVIDGKAEGAIGYVVAKHAGAWHVVIEFCDEDLKKMRLKDPVQVYVYGSGFKLLDYPDINLTSIDPECFEAMNIQEKGGKLHVPVAGIVPAELMGSGLGCDEPMGDTDFMASDWEYIKECGLDEIKMGDVVMVKDIDARYGCSYKRGATSLGIIVHGDCPGSGHGPGVTFFMATDKPLIVPVIDKTANIKKYHDAAYGKLKPMPKKSKSDEAEKKPKKKAY